MVGIRERFYYIILASINDLLALIFLRFENEWEFDFFLFASTYFVINFIASNGWKTETIQTENGNIGTAVRMRSLYSSEHKL